MNAAVASGRVRTLDDLPHPPGLPLLGNLHQIKIERLHQILEGWAAQYGSPFTFRVGRRRAVVWSDMETLHAVLRERPQRFRRVARMTRAIREIGADGLFAADDGAWQPQRRLVMQALNASNFRGFHPVLHAITDRLRRRWRAAAERGEVFDMTRDLMRYTVDVTCALAFGEDPNTIDGQDDAIQQHLGVIFPTLERRFHAPFPYWRHFKLPRDRRLDRSLRVVQDYIARMMEGARRRLATQPSDGPRNLLEAMLVMRDTPGSNITDAQVSGNVMTLLLAGEDTTAHSLAWTMPHLATDPDLQLRLHREATDVLGADRVCSSYDALRRLDRFEALATEATRLRGVVSMLAHEPVEDTSVGDVHVPAGTSMLLLLRPVALQAEHFEDPRRYDPGRWLRERTEHAGVHEPRGYLQFGTGPRVCPGRHLSGVEIRLVLSMLMRNFSLELMVDPAAIEESWAVTVAPSRMPVRLTPRPAD